MMKTTTVEVADDILGLLARSKLGSRPPAEQIQMALAIHLFQEGVISVGKAAELAGEPRPSFERLLVELGIPPVQYDEQMYEADLEGLAQARERSVS
jgi:predicted HTH domain antitoxin